MRRLVILGAGGMAREVRWYALKVGFDDLVFVDETVGADSRLESGGPLHRIVNDWSAFGREEALACYKEFVVAVGNTALKRRLTAMAIDVGLRAAPTLIHPDARVHGLDCSVGVGGVIAPGCQLTTNITLGDFVVLGINCAIGHDSRLGDYVTCNPGCQVSGNVVLGAGVLIGTGASVREKVRIADNVSVGAQACVVKDLDTEGLTVVGVPARRLG